MLVAQKSQRLPGERLAAAAEMKAMIKPTENFGKIVKKEAKIQRQIQRKKKKAQWQPFEFT